MKKITETKLINIVNKVLNEQKIRQFNENEIELLHFIFERELKPPFRKGEKNDIFGARPYYNRDGEFIGQLYSLRKTFSIIYDPFWINIKYKVCQVFEFSYDTMEWWLAIEPHLKFWLENQINAEVKYVDYGYG